MQHTPQTSLQARASKPYMHATGRTLEGVEVVADHLMAREAMYALQVLSGSANMCPVSRLQTNTKIK